MLPGAATLYWGGDGAAQTRTASQACGLGLHGIRLEAAVLAAFSGLVFSLGKGDAMQAERYRIAIGNV